MNKYPELNEVSKKAIKNQLETGDIDVDFLIDYIFQINKTYNALINVLNNLNGKEIVNITIQLIRYHYEHNEEKYREYCHNFIKAIKEYDTDGQITGYILAQMNEVPSFIPM